MGSLIAYSAITLAVVIDRFFFCRRLGSAQAAARRCRLADHNFVLIVLTRTHQATASKIAGAVKPQDGQP